MKISDSNFNVLAAILDAMMDVRFSDYQMAIELVLIDSLTPKTIVQTPKLQLYDEKSQIYSNSNVLAAILDAILTPFRNSDFLRFLVC